MTASVAEPMPRSNAPSVLQPQSTESGRSAARAPARCSPEKSGAGTRLSPTAAAAVGGAKKKKSLRIRESDGSRSRSQSIEKFSRRRSMSPTGHVSPTVADRSHRELERANFVRRLACRETFFRKTRAAPTPKHTHTHTSRKIYTTSSRIRCRRRHRCPRRRHRRHHRSFAGVSYASCQRDALGARHRRL